ncbi:v-SNARE [Durotheca rogersii]|uniref:v-SNARE n=1 Tax=Durotheca rogersii TaxID=419775 RepID=UPI00221F0886|nr:v-SNARE [Durotheca rogersii]KAI5858285.1 v-SNARE [Durotheca rogersii]
MSNPNQLYLLADHVKLSLLERQRARSLNLLDGDSNDGHISRSLDQFRDGLALLAKEQKRLEDAGDEDGVLAISDALPTLQKQYDDLISQFHGFSSPSSASTLTHANDPALEPDFEHATAPAPAAAAARASSPSASATPANAPRRSSRGGGSSAPKTVRFSDNPSSADADADLDLEAAQRELFGPRYRDDPASGGGGEGGDGDGGAATLGYRDEAEALGSNVQIHAYHRRILDEQDAQLDALGASIARQRELSLRIGDELDEHVAMLDDVDGAAGRHLSRLDRARRRVGRLSRAAGESRQMIAIVVLIVVLVLLIAVLK